MDSKGLSIQVLGVFGKLVNDQEEYFQKLQAKYSKFPKDEDIDTFNHLSLVVNAQVTADMVPTYKELLDKLKAHLPLKLAIKNVLIIENEHIALAFDLKQTQQIRKIANECFSQGTIKTHYVKVVRFVPKQKQEEVIDLLGKIKALIFDDFVLCANHIDSLSIIYTSRTA